MGLGSLGGAGTYFISGVTKSTVGIFDHDGRSLVPAGFGFHPRRSHLKPSKMTTTTISTRVKMRPKLE